MPNYCYKLQREEINSVTGARRWVDIYPAPDGACPACSGTGGSTPPVAGPQEINLCNLGLLASGTYEISTKTYKHTGAATTLYYRFRSFTTADDLSIRVNNVLVVNTGCLPGIFCGQFNVATNDIVEVVVDGTCSNQIPTLWELTINCSASTADCNNNTQQSDLSLTIELDDPTAILNQQVEFSLLVSNAGPAAASGLTVEGTLPLGLDFSGSPDGVTYNSGTRKVSVNIGDVAVGATITKSFFATVNDDDVDNSRTFRAEIKTANQTDPDSVPNTGYFDGQDDTDSETVTVQGGGGNKTVSIENTSGQTVVVEFIQNNGSGTSHTTSFIVPNETANLTMPDNPNYRICLSNVLGDGTLVRLTTSLNTVLTGNVAQGSETCIDNQTLLNTYVVRA